MRLLRSITICGISLAFALSSRAQTSSRVPYDFNGDGYPDIVWRNYQTGTNEIWYMNGNEMISIGILPSMPDGDLQWRLAVICDYNNDGFPDIVWRNYQTGKNQVWFMNNTTLLGTLDLPTEPDANWGLTGAGDFNGDGQVDLVWRHSTTGQNVIWLMSGAQNASTVELQTVSTEWHIAAVADFSGDGKPDVLWTNFWRGLIEVWTMDGSSFTSAVNVGTWSDPNLRIQSTIVDSTGQPAILWRNYKDGSDLIQSLANLQFGNIVSLPAVADTNWQMAGTAGIDPTTLLSSQESTMLQEEEMTLSAGGYDDIGGLPVVSALYTMHGELVFTFPPLQAGSTRRKNKFSTAIATMTGSTRKRLNQRWAGTTAAIQRQVYRRGSDQAEKNGSGAISLGNDSGLTSRCESCLAKGFSELKAETRAEAPVLFH